MNNVKYKHTEHVIDIRDKNLVTWNPKRRIFTSEVSMLSHLGFSLYYAKSDSGMKPAIYLWSEKHQISIPYIRTEIVKNSEGEHLAEIYKPISYFGSNQSKALDAYLDAQGTEFHIYND
jgi:hypothetical protein